MKTGIVGTRRMNDYKKFKKLVEPVLANIKVDAIVSGALRKAKKFNKQVIIIKI